MRERAGVLFPTVALVEGSGLIPREGEAPGARTAISRELYLDLRVRSTAAPGAEKDDLFDHLRHLSHDAREEELRRTKDATRLEVMAVTAVRADPIISKHVKRIHMARPNVNPMEGRICCT